jgi:glycosyltransferase involved in cell wall biosynthesis
MRHQAAFAERFYAAAQELPAPDLLIAPIPTVEAAERAVAYARERGSASVVDVRDRWPEELVRLAPRVARPLARRLAASLYDKARFACRNADGIVGVSDGEVAYGLGLAGRERTERDACFPLGYSLDQLEAQRGAASAPEWIDALGLEPGAVVGSFVGTIGRYFDLDTVIGAVECLRRDLPVQVVLAGSGSSLARVRRAARGSAGVLFPGWISGPQIAALLARSDFALAPYRADATMSFPNKPFEYMACSLPIVSSLRGPLEALLAERRCGLTYRADSVDELCACIRTLARDPDERRAMGARGRQLLLERFESEVVFRRAEEHLQRIVAPAESARRYAHS